MAVLPTTKYTNHFLHNRLVDPISNTVIERTYGGLVIPPYAKRRIRTADINILQNDAQLETDLLNNEMIVTYPVLYLKGTMGGAFPEGFISNDGFTSAAVEIIKGLGQRQGYHSISFQRLGLISLPQSGSAMLPTDTGGVWLKHGGVPCDSSPPAVTSSPNLLRMATSWKGDVLNTDSLYLDVLIRKDNTFPWELATGGQHSGNKASSSTVNLAGSDYGNSPEIAVRIKAGVITDLTVDLMITGK